MKNILGEYSSFFKPSTGNYYHLNWKKLVSKRLVLKRLCIETTVNRRTQAKESANYILFFCSSFVKKITVFPLFGEKRILDENTLRLGESF